MNKHFLPALALSTLLLPVAASAASPLLELSEPQRLGDGEIRVFGSVLLGYPLAMGVVFDGDVFRNGPHGHSDGRWDVLDANGEVVWPCCGYEFDFDAPDNIAAATAFEHIVVNWNPHGHVPHGVYTHPHFDFHFYTQTRAERLAITAPAAEDMCNDNVYGIPGPIPLDCEQLDLAMMPLPADQQPPRHSNVAAVEPGMGNHLIDLSSPEFNDEAFTHTFIFGTWAGELTYWEPMITKDFLMNSRPRCYDIPNPRAAPEAGWYPGSYCVQYIRGLDQYTITMTRFEWLRKSRG